MSARLSPLYTAAAGVVRKHSRISVIAASAAVVGTLSVAVVAVVAAGSAPSSGQASDVNFDAMTGSHPASGKAAPGNQLDSLRAAGTGGSTGTVGAVDDSHANQAGTAADSAANAAAANAAAAKAAAAKASAARATAAKESAARAAAAKAKAAREKAAMPAKPYLVYDSVSPSSIPSGNAAAVYANGSYAASASQTAGHRSVLWIDTNASDPAANALDVEPGDATPTEAANWVHQRLTAHSNSVAIVYTMLSEWQQVKDQVAGLPAAMQSKVRYWIADPTGVPHVVAGSSATQWYWGANYDITTANPDFAR